MVVQDKSRAKNLLQRHLDRIPVLIQSALDLIPTLGQLVDSPEFTKWERDTRLAIENIFGQNSRNAEDFNNIDYYPNPVYLSDDSEEYDFHLYRAAYIEGLEKAEAILQSMIGEIEEYWPDDDQAQNPAPMPQIQKQTNTSQVFIIHGRDIGTRDTIARFLESLDLEPVILQEQPDRSRTIIEKFEDYAQVDFAIALFTPDDFGGPEGGDPKSRARQNVIFEFGYFIGKYGRKRVRALVKGDIEIPSDYSGVLYIPLDDSAGWKIRLVGDLKSAGFDVDANRIWSTPGN